MAAPPRRRNQVALEAGCHRKLATLTAKAAISDTTGRVVALVVNSRKWSSYLEECGGRASCTGSIKGTARSRTRHKITQREVLCTAAAARPLVCVTTPGDTPNNNPTHPFFNSAGQRHRRITRHRRLRNINSRNKGLSIMEELLTVGGGGVDECRRTAQPPVADWHPRGALARRVQGPQRQGERAGWRRQEGGWQESSRCQGSKQQCHLSVGHDS
jgi:hypothetical protein